MPASRVLPTEEATDLLELVREIAAKELAPRAAEAEATETFPRDVFRMLGPGRAAGAALPRGVRRRRPALRGLPPGARGDRRRSGPASASASRVHALSCFGLATYGTEEQKQRVAARHARRRAARRLLPLRAARRLRPGRDAHHGAPRRRRLRHQRRQGLDHARRPRRLLQGDGPHRRDGRNGISCFLVPADADGPDRRPARAEDGAHRLGHRDDALRRRPRPRRPAARRRRATGLKIALAGLDSGRLGIAAVATGLAQGALDHAVAYAQERETFGKRIIDHQGLAFVLADMEAAVESARATTLHAARLKDRGLPFAARRRSPSWSPPTTP